MDLVNLRQAKYNVTWNIRAVTNIPKNNEKAPLLVKHKHDSYKPWPLVPRDIDI